MEMVYRVFGRVGEEKESNHNRLLYQTHAQGIFLICIRCRIPFSPDLYMLRNKSVSALKAPFKSVRCTSGNFCIASSDT